MGHKIVCRFVLFFFVNKETRDLKQEFSDSEKVALAFTLVRNASKPAL